MEALITDYIQYLMVNENIQGVVDFVLSNDQTSILKAFAAKRSLDLQKQIANIDSTKTAAQAQLSDYDNFIKS